MWNLIRGAALAVALSIFAIPIRVEATALGDLAATMPAGSFAELKTNGLSRSYVETTPGGGPVIEYANGAAWNPIARQVLFLGAPHFQPWKFLIYDDTSNSWTSGPLPLSCMSSQSSCIGHGYDHNAIDATTGDLYHRMYNSRDVYRYRAGTWSAIPSIPSSVMASVAITGGLRFFPEMGRLVYTQGDTGSVVAVFNPTTNAWTRQASGLAMGPYHTVQEYSAATHSMFFGGGNGSNLLYRMTSTGAINSVANFPLSSFGINMTNMAADPVTGNLIVTTDSGAVYEYQVAANSWRRLAVNTPEVLLNPDSGRVAIVAPISTYGVIMYVTYDGQTPQVFLYKHGNFVPQPTPLPPGGLQVR